MRSYYAHLENTDISKTIPSKPVFRSSAIFPMINLQGIYSRVIFMGYWILKRNIREIAAIINLRDESGKLIHRMNLMIQEPRAYRIELQEELAKAGFSRSTSFIGSLEVEFFSTNNLFYPFPAVVLNYYGDKFSTVVHTAQRVYNDFEDMQRNSQTSVPESGFNIYANDSQESFLGIINGPEVVPDATLQLQVFNYKKEVTNHQIILGDLSPYQAKIVYPGREMDLIDFLQGNVGVAKASFHLNWVFPRLLVGNIDHSLPSLSITHTYYDCSKANSDADYWRPSEPQWYPASLMIPVSIKNSHFTNVYFYPIYSPSHLSIDLEIYDSLGSLLGKKQNILDIESPGNDYKKIPIKEICKELSIPENQELGARIICKPIEGSRLPTRIKIGLDLGMVEDKMPCNICTNLHPFNPGLESKPISFHWSPFLADQKCATVWLMNSSPLIKYSKAAEIELTFFREKDATTLVRKIIIPPNGFIVIHLSKDKELEEFFCNQIGWLTAVTTNSYTSLFYFTENSSGVVGGDHGF